MKDRVKIGTLSLSSSDKIHRIHIIRNLFLFNVVFVNIVVYLKDLERGKREIVNRIRPQVDYFIIFTDLGIQVVVGNSKYIYE